MPEQKILVGSTQTILSYPRVQPGGPMLRAQPASATVRIGTPAISLPTSYSAASVDSTSVITDAVEEGETTIGIQAGTTIVAGRQYLVDLYDSGDILSVVAKNGGADQLEVETAEPVPMAIPEDSSLLGWACYTALTTGQTAQPGNCLALWRAVIDGVTYEWSQSFRIVRRIPSWTLTPTILTQSYPTFHALRPGNDLDLEETIQMALEHRLLRSLNARGVAEEDIISTSVLEAPHALACVLQVIMGDPSQSTEFVERIRSEYERALDSAMASTWWHEQPQSENPSSRPSDSEPNVARFSYGITR